MTLVPKINTKWVGSVSYQPWGTRHASNDPILFSLCNDSWIFPGLSSLFTGYSETKLCTQTQAWRLFASIKTVWTNTIRRFLQISALKVSCAHLGVCRYFDFCCHWQSFISPESLKRKHNKKRQEKNRAALIQWRVPLTNTVQCFNKKLHFSDRCQKPLLRYKLSNE